MTIRKTLVLPWSICNQTNKFITNQTLIINTNTRSHNKNLPTHISQGPMSKVVQIILWNYSQASKIRAMGKSRCFLQQPSNFKRIIWTDSKNNSKWCWGIMWSKMCQLCKCKNNTWLGLYFLISVRHKTPQHKYEK